MELTAAGEALTKARIEAADLQKAATAATADLGQKSTGATVARERLKAADTEFVSVRDQLAMLRAAVSDEAVAAQATTDAEAQQQYLAGACDVFTTDASGLAATRATFENPADHVVLPEIISKEPLGPLVRHGDNAWGDIIMWTLNALISAEELGITSANVAEMAAAPTANPEINRILGTEGEMGAMMGLEANWAVNAIAAGGNYGELFEKNIGENTPIGLARGLNALWTQGGLQYSPPFR
jgi:general L-amino acid transport system substrate-binding protein